MQVKIVYASMTGNDEDMAEILEEDLQDAGSDVDSSDVSFTDASDCLNVDICVFVIYTYGEGKIIDELENFYDQLENLDLSGKKFLIMGSGDETYKDHYCENVLDFEKVFLACGAEEVIKPLIVGNVSDDNDIAKIDEIADELAEKFNG